MTNWLKGSKKPAEESLQKYSFWQMIFYQSKANNAPYDGDKLQAVSWHWPKGTKFQRRLEFVRRQRQWERDPF